MELYDKYRDEIGQDLVVDDFNIKEVQMRLPARKHYWAGKLIDAKIQHQRLIKQREKLKKTLLQNLIETSPMHISPQSAEKSINSSDAVTKINELIQEYAFIIEYLEKIEKIMGQMVWEIKNIIEINKMEQL